MQAFRPGDVIGKAYGVVKWLEDTRSTKKSESWQLLVVDDTSREILKDLNPKTELVLCSETHCNALSTVNSSCRPNTEFQSVSMDGLAEVVLVAKYHVKFGDEVTAFYGAQVCWMGARAALPMSVCAEHEQYKSAPHPGEDRSWHLCFLFSLQQSNVSEQDKWVFPGGLRLAVESSPTR